MAFRYRTTTTLAACAALSIILVGCLLANESPSGPGVTGNRYLGHLSTDKPIYHPGDCAYFRGVILGALDHKPMPDSRFSYVTLQITGPHGEQLFAQNTQIQDSALGFAWNVPSDAPGGRYAATLSFPSNGFPPTTREFDVRTYRAPRLKGEIIFLRDGYGPGDTVKASLHVERAEGGLPAGAKVSANAIVDGKNAYAGQTTVDSNGNCSVEFPLPAHIEQADGTLSLTVADGGVVEPIAKTIPILLHTVDLSIYPEGGDLVAGVASRVYIEARTTAQKPADLVGQVIDSHGNPVVAFTTEHEGRGRFLLTPRAGETYAIKLSRPADITQTYPLPAIKSDGVVLQSTADMTDAGEPIRLTLAATEPGKYIVTLTKRQTEAASTPVKLTPGQTAEVVLTPPDWADGVLVATVKNSDDIPVAERLIFRKSAGILHVKVTTDLSSYTPADPLTVTIATTDDSGKPVPAVVGVTATDQSILRMLEKRDRAPRLGEMVLLEDDVRELADAEVYLDPTDPKAPLATDLLLGTQGWRRFADADPAKFMSAYGDAARRVLGDLQPPVTTAAFGAFGGGGLIGSDHYRFKGLAQPASTAAMPGEFINDKDQAAMKQEGQRVTPAADIPNLEMAVPPGQQFGNDGVRAKFMPWPGPVVRVYAHDLRPNRSSDDRSDFIETLFWAAGVKTDDHTGTATVAFHLNDSVTSFDITADAFDASGELGEGKTTISSTEPFYLEPKLPLEVSSGDVIRLPIAAVNTTHNDLDNVQLKLAAAPGISISPIDPFTLPAGQRLRQLVDLHIGSQPGTSQFVLEANAGPYSDRVSRPLVVKPLGFPTELNKSGTINAGSRALHLIQIPDSLVSGSVKTLAALYPTPLANLTEALQRLLQEPNGCFEQTSSTNYPLVMADQYFTTHTGVDPQLISQSNELLDKGYARLISFECPGKGYEWFGQDPGHECLTAYGLLEFTDMSTVRNVDQTMLANTRNWLMSHRDGHGGFTHERRSLHTWVTDPDCANGYCTWALLETGQTGLDAEVKWLADHAQSDPNSYVKALAANALFLAGDRDGARQFMDQLAQLQEPDGHVRGAITTVVGSGGESLETETTSLAALAWLRDPTYAPNVEQAIRYLADSCQAGRYGSTQSTVLALRAIVAYDKSRAHPTKAGTINLFIDNQPIGDPISFDAATTGAIKLPDFSSKMTPGQHAVELRMTHGSDLPYALSVSFNSATPASSDRCPLELTASLTDAQVTEGAATEARITLTSRSPDTLPSPIAIIGLPGGLEVRYDQLKELVKADRIASYEVRGRELILYWRDIQPNEKIQLPISLLAAIPGQYTAPASRAYFYYTDEFRQWLPGMKVTVTAK